MTKDPQKTIIDKLRLRNMFHQNCTSENLQNIKASKSVHCYSNKGQKQFLKLINFFLGLLKTETSERIAQLKLKKYVKNSKKKNKDDNISSKLCTEKEIAEVILRTNQKPLKKWLGKHKKLQTTILDIIFYNKHGLRLASRDPEPLKISDLRKKWNIRKRLKLGGDRAKCLPRLSSRNRSIVMAVRNYAEKKFLFLPNFAWIFTMFQAFYIWLPEA